MLRGVVNFRCQAVVRIRVRSPNGTECDVNAIIDSGFTASLTLPATVVNALGLTRKSGGTGRLADGSVSEFDISAAEVNWGGAWRAVLISCVGKEPLLGMRLLAGHELAIDVVPDGLVEITPLS